MLSLKDRQVIARCIGFICSQGYNRASKYVISPKLFPTTYRLHYATGVVSACLRLRSQAHKTLRWTRGSSFARVQWLFRVATALFMETGLWRQASWTCHKDLTTQEAVWFSRVQS
jgi:hypothetical protein